LEALAFNGRKPSDTYRASIAAFGCQETGGQIFSRFGSEATIIPATVEGGGHYEVLPVGIISGVACRSGEGMGYIACRTSRLSSSEARSVNADRKGSGNSRPRFSARRRMPTAAFGLKKYLGDTCACKTLDKLVVDLFGLFQKKPRLVAPSRLDK
jgi:hypothetical protein